MKFPKSIESKHPDSPPPASRLARAYIVGFEGGLDAPASWGAAAVLRMAGGKPRIFNGVSPGKSQGLSQGEFDLALARDQCSAVPSETNNQQPTTNRTGAEMNNREPMANKKAVVWRHCQSGVWIGWASASQIPGHVHLDGVRIRTWAGGRVDCSALSRQGVRESDVLTGWVSVEIAIEGSAEILETSDELVEVARRLADRWVEANEGAP